MIYRFCVYRPNIEVLQQNHDANQMNPVDVPQFEGVIFTTGRVVVQWLTVTKSVSIFDSFDDILLIHGHPEYGTRIEFADNVPSVFAEYIREKGFVLTYPDCR